MWPFPNSSPLFGLMALLRSMCSKTCRAAEAASMVASFSPGAQEVLVGSMVECSLYLPMNFLCVFRFSGSSDRFLLF